MDHLCKSEAGQRPLNDLKQDVEEKKHKFKFSLNSETYSVSCKLSMTVLEALNTSKIFRTEKNKTKNKQKQIIILRSNGEITKAAVKTDFPCCLVKKDESLEISFKEDKTNSANVQTTTDSSLSESKPETVTFWVKKGGGTNVKCLLKSDALRKSANYVCVWAFKGQTAKAALRCDGRFKGIIFKKHCGLSEFGSDTKHELSIPVEDLDRKAFQFVVISNKDQPDSQENWTSVNTEPNIASKADMTEEAEPIKYPINTNPEKKKTENTKKSTDSLTEQYVLKTIADSKELLEFLRAQFQDLLKTLKQRKNLKNNSDVQKFFRAEFSKSVENFSEVKKVKQLMRLSDSVCQIRKAGSALGTGFLLFDRFILTNAHVIGIDTDLTKTNFAEFTAVFNYEDLKSEIKEIPVKKLVAYFYGKDKSGCHLDYALLELDSFTEIAQYPELISCYSSNQHINRGQICIVGHPGEGVKKMDPCFIIEKEHLEEAANKHKAENADYIHVMTQKALEDKWEIHKNQTTYESCFFHGSSGSPVFDADCKLIGVHTGGYVYPKQGKKFGSVMEYSFSMQPILANIRAQAKIKGLHEIVNKLVTDGENVSETPECEN